MSSSPTSDYNSDPYDLKRFVDAQDGIYYHALEEIRSGRKSSHWMWFIFPQFDGLGHSSTAKMYAIKSMAEAQAYLNHPILGERLLECAQAALDVDGRSARDIFGSPDDLKLRSSATLFSRLSPSGSVFEKLIEKYFQNEPDDRTIQLLGN